jgi:hypothetical protein
LRWAAPYSGRSIGFQFGDVDHSNGGGGPSQNDIADSWRDLLYEFENLGKQTDDISDALIQLVA